jgi:hypothetical protein
VADDDLDADDAAQPDASQPDAALAVVARHALHDEEIVVAFATGSLDAADDAAEIGRARSLIERCTACRDLHRDIAAIGDVLRLDAQGTIAAPRDFRLTVEDARRLGGPVSASGFLAAFRRAMVSFARPVGASMATLGVVGLLVGSIGLGGGAASAPSATGAPAEITTGAHQPSDPKSTDRNAAEGPGSSVYGAVDGETPSDSAAGEPSSAAWLLAGSVALLVAGLVLLALTFRQGRRGGART